MAHADPDSELRSRLSRIVSLLTRKSLSSQARNKDERFVSVVEVVHTTGEEAETILKNRLTFLDGRFYQQRLSPAHEYQPYNPVCARVCVCVCVCVCVRAHARLCVSVERVEDSEYEESAGFLSICRFVPQLINAKALADDAKGERQRQEETEGS